jgi:lipid-A-disaccharide synthase
VVLIYFRARWLSFKMRRFVRRDPVDVVVLCDWGGFNCRQLKFFTGQRTPILYYFPPRSWQRSGAAGLQFATMATRVATPFQWSEERLRSVGCRADWVGHPLLESRRELPDRDVLRREFGVQPGEKLVALLPGSRISEINVLSPRMAAAAKILSAKGGVKFVVPVPAPLVEKARPFFPPEFPVLVGRASEALRASDAAMVKMGSATLEAAVIGAPQVAVYDFGFLSRIEWLLLWTWKKIPYIAMPNIILQRKLVTELLGLECRPDKIAAEIDQLLQNPEAKETMENGYQEIRTHLGGDLPMSASDRTAQILVEMIQGGTGGDHASGAELPTA